MTHRTGRLARVAAAMLLAGLLLPALAAPAGAADAITLEARPLVGGRFESNGWIAIAATLSNGGSPVTGYLAADGEDGTVRRFVELPAGAHKLVTIYLRPAAFVRTISIRFESLDGASLAAASAEARVLERSSGHVAIVGDGGGNVRPQLVARGTGFPEPIPLAPADLPERPEPLRGIETIVWAADSSGLTEAQQRSLERWVAAGGQLVVLGGPDWQARTAAFGELLPLEHLASSDGSSAATLAAWAGAAAPDGTDPLTAAVGDLRPGAVSLVRDAAGHALFAAITRGAGRVSFVGIDLATEPFRSWAGASPLWTRLLPDDRIIEQWGGMGPIDDDVANAMSQALANLPSLAVPSAALLLAVIVGYILLIGPLSYLVLRRLDRRELAWVVAPILVLVFSGVSYGIGASMKGSQIIVNQIAVVRTSTDGTAASVSTYAGIFSPTRASYDLTVRGDALLSALAANNVDPTFSGQAVNYATEQGDPSHLRGLAVSVFGLQAIRAEAVIPYTASLRVTWSVVGSDLEGRAANDGTQTMEDVAVISRSGGVMVGTLGPGQSKAFRMPLRNLTGSSASQGVYGTAAFDTSTAAQRRISVRSQVIDALVGYAGGFPGKVGGVAGGIDRGPFVIGWQSDASPVQVEIDGEQVQHYAQAVEVISGGATLGPGPVTLSPSELSTEVLATDGEASQNQPGSVTLANGEVTFRLGLPLEASALQPTQLTVIVASDPGTIFYDQENVGAFLPKGFRLAVYDTVAGDWFDLGDLSQRSRFDVDDPARVLDPSGRLLVKISATGIPADMGQISIFAGARVSGVVAQ
ncbi:MAG TPA: hypothetical protein VL687_07565 [Methylomirabilota bacterium]|nr:hypothetical protein [Methylomirabilota bacterium]